MCYIVLQLLQKKTPKHLEKIKFLLQSDLCAISPLISERSANFKKLSGDVPSFSGRLRVSCTPEHLQAGLAQVLASFVRQHPLVQLDVRASDEIKDPIREGLDVSFRLGWLRDSTQRAVQIGTFTQHVVASPEYWRNHSPIKHPKDLAAHGWIALMLLRSPLQWLFSHHKKGDVKVKMKSQMSVDSMLGLSQMLRCHCGVSIMDSLSARDLLEQGQLATVLDDWQLPQGGIYAVYPPGKYISPMTQALVAYYKSELTA